MSSGAPTATSSTTPRDPIEAAVWEVFQELVARPPTPAERAEWTGKLARGVPVRELRALLEATPEHTTLRALGKDIRAVQETGLFDDRLVSASLPGRGRGGDEPAAALRRNMGCGKIARPIPGSTRSGIVPRMGFGRRTFRCSTTCRLARRAACARRRISTRPGIAPPTNWGRSAPRWRIFAGGGDARRWRPAAEMWAALGLPEPVLTDVADDVFLSIGDDPADYVVLRDQGLFDENYYALHSGDVLATGADLLRHYCEFGWREQRQPNFYFDSRWYTATNPEVEELGVNPLSHYLLVGEPEGRRPIVFFDPVWYRETYDVPEELSALAHFLAHRREGKVSPNQFFDPVYYYARKGEAIRPGRDPFARFLVAGSDRGCLAVAEFRSDGLAPPVDGPGVAEFPAFAGSGEGQSAGALYVDDVSVRAASSHSTATYRRPAIWGRTGGDGWPGQAR